MPRRYKRKKIYRRRRPAMKIRHVPASVKMSSAQSSQPITTLAKTGWGMYEGYAEKLANQLGYGSYYAAGKMAYKALEMLNAELKYYDASLTSFLTNPGDPATTGEKVYSLFSGITVGDGPNNRDGSQIRVKTIQLQLTMNQNALATGVTKLRYVIFKDTRPDIGSTPSYTDVFNGTSVSGVFYNISDQWRRWRILRNNTLILAPGQTAIDADFYMPCSIPVRYDVSGNINYNPVYIMLASDEPTNTPTVGAQLRVRFYDN